MREILFRGKRTDNNEWVYGGYWENQTTRSTVHIIDKSGDSIEIIPKTVGQFTGLKDKNNKMIFEGDIVNWGCGMYVIVQYVKEYARFAGIVGDSVFPLEDTERRERVEIVGNIYENSVSLNKNLSVI